MAVSSRSAQRPRVGPTTALKLLDIASKSAVLWGHQHSAESSPDLEAKQRIAASSGKSIEALAVESLAELAPAGSTDAQNAPKLSLDQWNRTLDQLLATLPPTSAGDVDTSRESIYSDDGRSGSWATPTRNTPTSSAGSFTPDIPTRPQPSTPCEHYVPVGMNCGPFPRNLYEFWVMATRLADQNGLGFVAADVARQLATWRKLFLPLRDERGILHRWQSLVTCGAVHGKSAHDVTLVAAMEPHGLTRLLTVNLDDFWRYLGIQLLDPSQVTCPRPCGARSRFYRSSPPAPNSRTNSARRRVASRP